MTLPRRFWVAQQISWPHRQTTNKNGHPPLEAICCGAWFATPHSKWRPKTLVAFAANLQCIWLAKASVRHHSKLHFAMIQRGWFSECHATYGGDLKRNTFMANLMDVKAVFLPSRPCHGVCSSSVSFGAPLFRSLLCFGFTKIFPQQSQRCQTPNLSGNAVIWLHFL